MDRYAIFVDAGYFFAAGAQAAFGSQTPRKQISVKSSSAMLTALNVKASEATGNRPLLRTYWYDAMPGPRLSLEQTSLAMLPGVKLRLGALNSAGEQKGVDSLIVTDIIELARNGAIADAVLVTGGEDLRIAVQIAQSFGVRVHILAAGDPSKNVSPSLQMEADSVTTLDGEWFLIHLELTPAPSKAPMIVAIQASAAPSKAIGTSGADEITVAAKVIVDGILDGIQPEHLTLLIQHFITQTSIPPEYDRRLIAQVSATLSGRRFSGEETRHIRGQFVRAVKARADSNESKK